MRPSVNPLSRCGKQAIDFGQRRGVIAAAQPGQRGAHQVRPQGQAGMGQQHHRPRGGDEQHGRREHRPVASAEPIGGHRIRDAREPADQGGGGTYQQLVAGRKAVDRLGHEQHHHRPQVPNREGDMDVHDLPEQISASDGAISVVPGRGVFRIPDHDVMRTRHAISTFRRRCCRAPWATLTAQGFRPGWARQQISACRSEKHAAIALSSQSWPSMPPIAGIGGT